MIKNVGLTTLFRTPTAAANPFTKVVFPHPRSPTKATTNEEALGLVFITSSARKRARRRVSLSLFETYFTTVFDKMLAKNAN